jgi:hypothetical protein
MSELADLLCSCILVPTVMGVFAVAAIFSEIGNGANFALVPHCNAYNNVSSRAPNSDESNYCLAGCYVWYRRQFWQSGWLDLRTYRQISDSPRESILDHWCDVYCNQRRPNPYSCTKVLRTSL